MTAPEGMTQHQDNRLDGLPIHYARTHRDHPDGLVVLMPSALSSKREDRSRVYFTRGTWHDEWPNAEVVSISDPAVQQSPKLNGAWFIHPKHDIIRALTELVKEIAETEHIPHTRVVFYGSSLGGFGAIGAAAYLSGARAIAEVPQVDFGSWFTGAIKAVEKYIIGMPLDDYRDIRPEQLSLQSRLELAGRVPSYRLITNPSDPCIADQRNFYAWSHSSSLSKDGPVEILETTLVEGHKVLGRSEVVPHIQP